MRILVAEDDALTRRIVERYMGKIGHQVETAPDGASAWQRFQSESFPLVITDWDMPLLTGPELIQRIRQGENELRAYIILLTSKGDKHEIVEGIETGADDYIVKPFDPKELEVRVRAGQRIVDLQQRLVNANRELERLADTDPLTGLFNRRALMKRVRDCAFLSHDPNHECAVIMTDIDNFKQVNDTHGHDAGDEVIREFALRLKTGFSRTEWVARIGGEEFVIICSGLKKGETGLLCEEVRKQIANEPIILSRDKEIAVTASFGACCVHIPRFECIDRYSKIADEAMYVSKNAGRNRVTVRYIE